MLLCMDLGKEHRVDVLCAVYLLENAWRQVSVTTIADCFSDTGFASITEKLCTQDEPDVVHDEVNEDLLLENCAAMDIQLQETCNSLTVLPCLINLNELQSMIADLDAQNRVVGQKANMQKTFRYCRTNV